MKTIPSSRRGFSLIEILVAVLIAGLIIGSALVGVTYARRTGAIKSVRSAVESAAQAVTLYLQRPAASGVVPLTESAAAAAFTVSNAGTADATALSNAARLDTVLLAEGVMAKPLTIGLGRSQKSPTGTIALNWDSATQAWLGTGAAPDLNYALMARLECRLTTPATAPSAAAGGNFRIDGVTNLPTGSRVQYLVIPNVQASEAAEIANEMGGMTSASTLAANDTGPVAYAAPDASTGLTTLYIYVSHQ